MTAIYAFGSNFFGQLGIGNRKRPNTYDQTLFGDSDGQALDQNSVQDIQCGAQFSVILQKNGSLSICGSLNGNVFPVPSPLDIPLPVRCVQMSCGRKHVLLLMERNIVMSWGTGYFGQLGHGDDSSWDSPRMISALEPRRLGSKVQSVACGGSHSGVLTDTGRVFMWGLNRSGQCGQGAINRGKTDSILEPRPVDFSNSFQAGSGEVRSLVCGRSHSAVLTSAGRVYTWGDAGFGRLGLNDVKKTQPVPAEVVEFRSTPAAALASGDFHMMALTRDGEVYSWGYGADGQTGHRAMLNVRLPKKVPFFSGLQAHSIACGALWSMVITADGSLYCCGYGDGGWLGMQPPPQLPQVEVDSLSPIQASLLPEAQREVRCFDSRHSVLQPRRVDCLSRHAVRAVRGGAGHTIVFCAPRTGGSPAAQDPVQQTSGVSGVKALSRAPSAESDEKDYSFGYGSAGIASSSGERRPSNPSSREVSSKLDAKGGHSHHPPLASYHLSSAGDASGSNSSLSSFHVAQHKSGSGSSPKSSSTSGKGLAGLSISAPSAAAVSKISAVAAASGASVPLSPNSATLQLFSWVRHKKVTELSSFLHGGGDANTPDSAGNTPLIVACQNGHLQVCKLLLTHGADLNASNHKGNTALHYCFSYGYEEIGNYLIECGADDLQTNAEGLTCYEGLTHSDLELL